MQLKNNIYKIIGKEDKSGVVDYTIQLIPSCFIYQAHFPGEPITPGVLFRLAKNLLKNCWQNKHQSLRRWKLSR